MVTLRRIALLWGTLLVVAAGILLPTRHLYPPLAGTLALVSDATGDRDIYTLDIATRQLTNLTQSLDFDEEAPAWSPDGRWLAFIVRPTGERPTYGEMARNGMLQIMRPDGSERQVLPASGVTPSWSPDGRAIYYADWRWLWPDERGRNYPQASIMRLDLETETQTPVSPPLRQGAAMAYSGLVYSRGGGFAVQQFNAWSLTSLLREDGYPLLGGLPRTWDSYIWHARDGAPSPDGRVVALFTIRNQTDAEGSTVAYNEGRISLINVDGTRIIHLSPPLFGGSPTWSPGGHYVAFDVVGGDGRWGVQVVRADGRALTVLTPFDGNHYFAPDWRPR